MDSTRPMGTAGKRGAHLLQVVVWTALGIVLLGTLLEAAMDFFNVSFDASALAQNFVTQPQRFGVALVGIEESGLPLPISGDLLIMYSASRAGSSLNGWIPLGIGYEIAVLVGSSILFVISRRWGPGLLLGAPGRALQLTPQRIGRVEGSFRRWGIWAVIFGRHVPGFHVAVTVVAASFEIRYRVFIAGVAISAAVWVTVFMSLGLLVGPKAAQLLGTHQNSSLAILGAVGLIGLVLVAGRMAWHRRRKPAL